MPQPRNTAPKKGKQYGNERGKPRYPRADASYFNEHDNVIDSAGEIHLIGKVHGIDKDENMVCVKWQGSPDGVYDYVKPSDLIKTDKDPNGAK